jgi:hypothetical protein
MSQLEAVGRLSDEEAKSLLKDVPQDGSVTIEVAGVALEIFKDGTGKVWRTPVNLTEDFTDSLRREPLDFPKDPRFDYQAIKLERVQSLMSTGHWAVVTRAEVGYNSPEDFAEYGEPESTALRIGDCVIMKTPMVYAEAARAAMNREAREARTLGMPESSERGLAGRAGPGEIAATQGLDYQEELSRAHLVGRGPLVE